MSTLFPPMQVSYLFPVPKEVSIVSPIPTSLVATTNINKMNHLKIVYIYYQININKEYLLIPLY